MKDFLYMKISRNLKGNMCIALVLLFITIMSYLIFCLVFKIFIFITIQTLFNYNLINQALFVEKFALYLNLISMLLIVLPLNLSVKNWYYNLEENSNTSLAYAFVVFETFKNYTNSVVFCTIKTFIIIINSFVFLLPSVYVISLFKYMNLTNDYSNTLTTIVLFIGFLTLIIGFVACIINYINFIFVDYIFLRNINNKLNLFNYFKMLKYSKQLAISNSKQLYLTLLKLTPLSIIFPIAIFSFKSGIAIHIKETIK